MLNNKNWKIINVILIFIGILCLSISGIELEKNNKIIGAILVPLAILFFIIAYILYSNIKKEVKKNYEDFLLSYFDSHSDINYEQQKFIRNELKTHGYYTKNDLISPSIIAKNNNCLILNNEEDIIRLIEVLKYFYNSDLKTKIYDTCSQNQKIYDIDYVKHQAYIALHKIINSNNKVLNEKIFNQILEESKNKKFYIK